MVLGVPVVVSPCVLSAFVIVWSWLCGSGLAHRIAATARDAAEGEEADGKMAVERDGAEQEQTKEVVVVQRKQEEEAIEGKACKKLRVVAGSMVVFLVCDCFLDFACISPPQQWRPDGKGGG